MKILLWNKRNDEQVRENLRKPNNFDNMDVLIY
jgi:hypothetical protein